MTSGARRELLRVALATTLIALGVRTAPAAYADTRWTLPRMMEGFAAVTSARTRFVERKFLHMLDRPLESSGTLAWDAPSRLEKITLQPKRERLLVERERVTVERGTPPKRRTLALGDIPLLRAFIESIRATLAGDPDTLQRFYEVTLEGTAEHWTLVLRPSDSRTKSLVHQIRISGAHATIATVEIEQADGDRSVMTMVRDDP